jgi:hypothetical protein
VTEIEKTHPPPAAADAAAIELIKAIHRKAARPRAALTAAQASALRDRLGKWFEAEKAFALAETILAHALAMRAGREAADSTLQDRRPLALARSAVAKAAQAWERLDELGRLRVLRRLDAFDGPGTLSQAIDLLPVIDTLLPSLADALSDEARSVTPRRGAPPIADEVAFLVEEVGRIWSHFGRHGRKGPPVVTNSHKAGGFADFVITAFAGPAFGFTPGQLKTAIRYHVAALRRAAEAAARKRAS